MRHAAHFAGVARKENTNLVRFLTREGTQYKCVCFAQRHKIPRFLRKKVHKGHEESRRKKKTLRVPSCPFVDIFYYSNISQREPLRSLLFSLFDSQKPIDPIAHFAPFFGQGEYWSKIK